MDSEEENTDAEDAGSLKLEMEPESAEQQCKRLLLLCQTGDWGTVGTMLEVLLT